jgi:hypothetical protein
VLRLARLGVLAALAGGLGACASTRTVTLASSRPAAVYYDAGLCRLCEQTPCRMTFSRETCWLFDSSSGFIRLRAITADGQSMSLIPVTCDLKSDEVLTFDFAKGRVEPAPTVYSASPRGRAVCQGLPRGEAAPPGAR